MSKESERIARQVGNSLAEKKRLEEQEKIQSILAQQKEIDNKLALEKAERESKQAYEAEIRRQKWEVFRESGIKEIFESIRDEKVVIWEDTRIDLIITKIGELSYAKIQVINEGENVGWRIFFDNDKDGCWYVEAVITNTLNLSINGNVTGENVALDEVLNNAFLNPIRHYWHKYEEDPRDQRNAQGPWSD